MLSIAIIRFSDYNIICKSIEREIAMEYITANEAAEKWNISPRRVQLLCKQGKVAGAVKLGWAWAIPRTAAKPVDMRLKKSGD